MLRIFFITILLCLLNNCAAPGTALLSPVITGAKTKSAHQASLSLASSLSSKKIIKDFKETKDSLINKRLKKKMRASLLTRQHRPITQTQLLIEPERRRIGTC